ncbi:MAG: Arm DNA-binding domain-containing protein [Gammaproteobacteria bacterium]
MTMLNDDYFRDLAPKPRRYDTPLGEGMVFSVFPNGTKCWVLVYSGNGYARRRTLGLFPEMNLAAAREAAGQALRILEVESELARSGEPSAVSGRRNLLIGLIEDRPLLAVALGLGFAALLGMTVVWLLG